MLRAESEQDPQEEEIVSMLIVLTDGNPNHGEIDKTIIERNVHEAINGDFSLFCIGFGADADYPFLRRLSLQVIVQCFRYIIQEQQLMVTPPDIDIRTWIMFNVQTEECDDKVDIHNLTWVWLSLIKMMNSVEFRYV